MARIPSIDDLAQLSRDEWQDLAMGLCSLLFSAHRVEDRFGKGNGLDGWRVVDGTLEGWQFRRFNDRLGGPQVDEIKADLDRAANRARSEHSCRLSAFTVVINIDPEPGHRGQKGEIQRLAELKTWAESTHGTMFSFLGVTWVRTQLLKYPFLRPDLFEDVTAAIDAARQDAKRQFARIEQQLEQLANLPEVQSRLDGAIALLLREARIHFERGNAQQEEEEYVKAIQTLQDASRLADGTLDLVLRGRILSLLAGVETIVGYLADAISHGRAAVALLKNADAEYEMLALGNLAFSLNRAQHYTESDLLFAEVLRQAELRGDLTEVLRTLLHITEGLSERKRLDEASKYSERMLEVAKSVQRLGGGPSELTLSAQGAAANVFAAMASAANGSFPQGHHRAIEIYANLEQVASKEGLRRIGVVSKAARATCVWHSDNPEAAEELFEEVADESLPDFLKFRADALLNLALVRSELGKYAEAEETATEASRLYYKIGDYASVEDAKRVLSHIASKG